MTEGFVVRTMGESRMYPYAYGFTIYQVDRTNVGAARIDNMQAWDDHIDEVTRWCFEQFGQPGDRWSLTHGAGYYRFDRETDAAAFKLRWW
jgi:hypothetical protein